MKKIRLLGLVCAVFIAILGTANATPVKYDVTGSAEVWGDRPEYMNISGQLTINDLPTSSDNDWDVYQILSFEFNVGEFSFFGNTGSIEHSVLDDYLYLYGNGDWSSWVFSHEERALGSGLSNIMHYSGDTHFIWDQFDPPHDVRGGSVSFDLTSSPVPEPSTLILLSCGLACLTWRSRKRKKA